MATKEGVVDTIVLRGANIPLDSNKARRKRFKTCLGIIHSVIDGKSTLLVSNRLVTEYDEQITKPYNDAVKLILEYVTTCTAGEGHARHNWVGRKSIRERALKCRFPVEDYHLLQTAKLPNKTKSKTCIITFEKSILDVQKSVQANFGIRITDCGW